MEQNPSLESSRSWASGEIAHTFWDQEVQYFIYKGPPFVPVLSQTNTIHALPSRTLKIHFNIILLSMPGSSTWPLSVVYSLLMPLCAMFPTLLILLDFTIQIIFGEQYRSLSSSLCSFLHSPGTSSVLGPNIFLSTVFLNILSLCFSLFVKDQLPCPYVLIIIYWIANWKTGISALNDNKHFLSWIPFVSFY